MRTVMLLVSLLEAAILIGVGVMPLPVWAWWKIFFIMLALLASFKFHLLHLVGGGRFFAPDLPGWVIMPMTWLHAAGVIAVLLLTALSLLRVFSLLWLRFSAGRWFAWSCPALTWGIAGVGICAMFLAAWGLWRGRSLPVVTEHEVFLSGLPESASGMRIVHLTDLHVDYLYPEGRYSEIVGLVNTLEADVIAVTGDFADGAVEELSGHFLEAPAFRARFGVFGVPGNHEYYSGYGGWRELVERCGIVMLDNRSVELPCGISVGGVTDLAALRFPDFPNPDVRGVADSASVRPLVLLSHQPKLAVEAAQCGVALQLSGHTHGGMLLGLSSLVSASNRGFVSGMYEVGAMHLYVSNGTGIWSGFPIRLWCPPEIAVITLRRAAAEDNLNND